MYAIILTGGKQYKVSVGDTLDVEKLDAEQGSQVELEVLMTVDGEAVNVGASVGKAVATVVDQHKGKKVVVFKYKAKKNVRKKKGHRQSFTKIKIDSIA